MWQNEQHAKAERPRGAGKELGFTAACGWTGGTGSSEWVARGPSGPVTSLDLTEAVGAIGVLAWEGPPTAMCRVWLGKESEIQEDQWDRMQGFRGQAHAGAGVVDRTTDWM